MVETSPRLTAPAGDGSEKKRMKVKSLMQTDIVTLRADDTLDIVEDILGMRQQQQHLPVIQANNRLIGMVSQHDLLRASLSATVQALAQTSQEWRKTITVRYVMTPGVAAVAAETDIEEALPLLLREQRGCLPVVNKNKLVGLLTETDFSKYFQHQLLGAHPQKNKEQ